MLFCGPAPGTPDFCRDFRQGLSARGALAQFPTSFWVSPPCGKKHRLPRGIVQLPYGIQHKGGTEFMAVFTNTNEKVHIPALDAGALLPAGARWSALAWQGAAAVTGAVLGAGQVWGGAAPFGLALVIGCPPTYLLASGVGALAGALAFQPIAMGLKLAGALAAAVAGLAR